MWSAAYPAACDRPISMHASILPSRPRLYITISPHHAYMHDITPHRGCTRAAHLHQHTHWTWWQCLVSPRCTGQPPCGAHTVSWAMSAVTLFDPVPAHDCCTSSVHDELMMHAAPCSERFYLCADHVPTCTWLHALLTFGCLCACWPEAKDAMHSKLQFMPVATLCCCAFTHGRCTLPDDVDLCTSTCCMYVPLMST